MDPKCSINQFSLPHAYVQTRLAGLSPLLLLSVFTIDVPFLAAASIQIILPDCLPVHVIRSACRIQKLQGKPSHGHGKPHACCLQLTCADRSQKIMLVGQFADKCAVGQQHVSTAQA